MPRLQILTVEDDAAIRRGMVDALRFAGYEPLEAADGDAGLEMATTREFDLLLLDLVLPKRDGLEILRRGPPAAAHPAGHRPDRPRRRGRPGPRPLATGPTITWSSRSASRSCWRGSRPCSAAAPSGPATSRGLPSPAARST